MAVTVPRRTELDPVAERLGHRGVEVADDGAPLRTRDPWRNRLTRTVVPASGLARGVDADRRARGARVRQRGPYGDQADV